MDALEAARVRDLIDRLLGDRTLVDKAEVERAFRAADMPEEVMDYVRGLPPGHYGREELRQRLIGPVSSEIPVDTGRR